MAFLREQDYLTSIEEPEFDVLFKRRNTSIVYSEDQIRVDAERTAQAKIESMICHRYDVGLIFKDILTFSTTTQYNIGELVEYSETAYSQTSTYSVNDQVSFKTTVSGTLYDDVYICITAVVSPEVFVAAKWTKQGSNNSLYVVKESTITTKPATNFVYTTNVYTGNHDTIKGWDTTNDLFFERDAQQVRIYYSAADRTAETDSIGVVDIGTQVKEFPANLPIESGTDSENTLSGFLNIIGFMPDTTQWSVVATNPFKLEDNRNRLMISVMIALVLFELHGRVNYRNIPDFRGLNKEEAMETLNDIKKGIIKPDLPLYHDKTTGLRIDSGSERKLNHTYFS